MTDYDAMVKALRVCKRYPLSCPYCVEETDYCRLRDMSKAADAIEELQRELLDLKMKTCCCCDGEETE